MRCNIITKDFFEIADASGTRTLVTKKPNVGLAPFLVLCSSGGRGYSTFFLHSSFRTKALIGLRGKGTAVSSVLSKPSTKTLPGSHACAEATTTKQRRNSVKTCLIRAAAIPTNQSGGNHGKGGNPDVSVGVCSIPLSSPWLLQT